MSRNSKKRPNFRTGEKADPLWVTWPDFSGPAGENQGKNSENEGIHKAMLWQCCSLDSGASFDSIRWKEKQKKSGENCVPIGTWGFSPEKRRNSQSNTRWKVFSRSITTETPQKKYTKKSKNKNYRQKTVAGGQNQGKNQVYQKDFCQMKEFTKQCYSKSVQQSPLHSRK